MSTFGAVNGILLTSSRLFYAGACEGQMPEILTMIQVQRFTPTPAVLAMALLSMLYLTVSDIFALINYVGFATWVRASCNITFSIKIVLFFINFVSILIIFLYLQLSIGAAVLCLPWLRWAQPNLPRPIKVNLAFPIFYLIGTAFITIVPMIASPVETGYGLLMILSSIPVYLLFIAWKNKPKWFQNGMSEYNIFDKKIKTQCFFLIFI